MKRILALFLCLFLLPVHAMGQTDEADYIPGEVIIKFKSQTNKADKAALLAEMGAKNLRTFQLIGATCEKLESLKTEDAIARFSKHPAIEYIQPNRIIKLTRIPNDPLFPLQYALLNNGQTGGLAGADIGASWAWEYSTGNRDIIVAIIDSGVDLQHPDLAGNLWINTGEIPGNGIDDDGNNYIDDVHGYDMSNMTGAVVDVTGHGTHIAGIIGAQTDNDVGVAGVCWNVSLMPVRYTTLNANSGTTNNVLASIEYAINNGAEILNLSWGGGVSETSIFDMLQVAADEGILIVAASGNLGTNNDIVPFYPASYEIDNIISVTGTEPDDQFGNYNYGLASVDLAAPGSYIHSTLPEEGYGNMSGTSMAAPFVAGSLALLMNVYPEKTPLELKSILLSSVKPLESLESIVATGGRLDLIAAMAENDMGPPTAVTDLRVVTTATNWVELEWTAPADFDQNATVAEYEFRYATFPLDESNFHTGTLAQNPPIPSPEGSAESFQLYGFDAQTSYYISMRSNDIFGKTSLVGNVVTTTALGQPTINLSVTSISSELATDGVVTRTISLGNTGNGILDFQIENQDINWPDWLLVSPLSGHISAGQTLDVTVSFDAAGLCTSQWEYLLRIDHNDQSLYYSEIPVSLNVTGETDIQVSDTYFSFGSVALGRTGEVFLEVTNAGCDLLTIHQASVDNPEYSVGETSFTLNSQESISLPLTFTPTTDTIISGNLLLLSDDPNDPEITITLTGRGLLPPAISLTPQVIDVQYPTGQVTTQSFTLTNTGGSDLFFGSNLIRTSHPDPTLNAVFEHILLLENGMGNIAHPFYSMALENLGLAYQLEIFSESFHTRLTDGTAWDLVLVNAGTDFTGDDLLVDLSQYVQAGGNLLFSDWDIAEYPNHQLLQSMGVQFHEDSTLPLNFSANDASNMMFNHPNAINTLAWNLFYSPTPAQLVTPLPGATGLASFDEQSTMQAVIRNQQGNSVFNAFQAANFTGDLDFDGKIDMVELIENEISFLAHKVPWATVTPGMGILQEGQTQSFELVLDARGYCSTQLDCSLVFADVTGIIEPTIVPVQMAVTASPEISASPLMLNYQAVGIGTSASITLLVSNTDCDTLTGYFTTTLPDEIFFPEGEFSIAAGDSQLMAITYVPNGPHEISGSVSIFSNAPEQPIIVIPVTGVGLVPPLLTIDTEDLTTPLMLGETRIQPLTLHNNGNMDLHWSAYVQADYSDKDLEDKNTPNAPAVLDSLLARLDASHAEITDRIPNMFDFAGGDTGYFIPSDGSGMYYSGNRLYTAPSNLLHYTEGIIQSSEFFGEQGRYFTAKYPGLFVMACEMSDVTGFFIDGTLDNSGLATVEQSIIELAFNGTDYQGFVKRTFDSAGPSVNHLIIIPKDISASQTTTGTPIRDDHKVFFSADTHQLYYLLFAGEAGAYIDDTAMLHIMTAFLETASPPPGWLTILPNFGIIQPGASEELVVTREAGPLCRPDVLANIRIESNSFPNPNIEIPARFEIISDPAPVLSSASLDFGELILGGSSTIALTLQNLGCTELNLTDIYCTSTDFSVAETALTVTYDNDHIFDVHFTPQTTGALEETLVMVNDHPDIPDIVIDLRGIAVTSPTITIGPDSIEHHNVDGAPFVVELAISNTGGSVLNWNLTTEFPEEVLPDLAGVRILMEQGDYTRDKANYYGFINEMLSRGAEISYNHGPLEVGALAAIDIFWINTSFFRHDAEYYSNLGSWILDGGSLLVAGSFYEDTAGINIFLDSVGAGLNYDSFFSYYSFGDTILAHDITRNVAQLPWEGNSSCITMTGPAPSALVLHEDKVAAAVSHAGHGWVLALGNDFLANERIFLRDNLLFSQQSIDWLSNPLWVNPVPASGSLAPGASETVTCYVNTLGHCQDVLSAQLHFQSNDILTPYFVIPFDVELDPVPSLVAQSDTLNFSTLMVGDSETLHILLANNGCMPLNITNLSFTMEEFSSPVSAVSVEPNDHYLLPVAFTPSGFGDHDATLSFNTDDPHQQVWNLPLFGSGRFPPVATMDADSVFLDISPNSFAYFDHTLRNTGEQPLIWDSFAASNELFPALDGENRILVLESGMASTESMMYARTLDNLHLPYTLVQTWPELEDQLENGGPWGFLVVNSYSGAASAQALDLVLEHILMGRRLMFSDANLGLYSDHPLLLELGVEYVSDSTEPIDFKPVINDDPLFRTPNYFYYVAPSHNQRLVDRPLVHALPGFTVRAEDFSIDHWPTIISSPSGKVIFNAFMSENYLASTQYYAHIITALIHNEVHSLALRKWFFWYYPRSGVIEPNEGITFDFYTETYTMAPGTYHPSITISTNDPLNTELTIHVVLNVADELIYEGTPVSSPAGWDMVGISLRAEDGNNSLGHIILDDAPAGSALFRYSNSTGYTEVEPEDTVMPGQGLWLATPSPFSWSMSGHPEVDGTRLPLQAGWNLIGYPLWLPGNSAGVMVEHKGKFRTFTSAAADGLISGTYFGLDQLSSAYVYNPDLQPGNSYWIASLADSVALHFDPSSMIETPDVLKKQTNTKEDSPRESWILDMACTGSSDSESNLAPNLGSIRIGRHPNGTSGYDAGLDMPAPPAIPGSGQVTGMRMLRPQWEQITGDAAWCDIRGLDDNPESWTCMVQPASGGSFTLHWDPEQLSEKGDLRIYRRGMGEFLVESMASANQLTLQSDGSAVYLEFCTTDYTPADMWLHADLDLRNAPNPFNPRTEIRFNLPREGQVSVRIFDVRGAQVMKIAGGKMSPGPGFISWSGQTTTGGTAASGVYFYRLFLNNQRLGSTGKMMLLK